MSITITQPQTTSRRARHVIAVLIAAGAVVFGYRAVQAMTDDPPMRTATPAAASLDVSAELADWAHANGVVGLSPASAAAPAAASLDVSAELADWAQANGVVGLSPASAGVPAAAGLDVSAELADWAQANGVVGLSPASAGVPD